MTFDSEKLINKLRLIPHPEGGFFKEVYRSEEVLDSVALPKRYEGSRNFSTSIYYLLNSKDFSAFHKLLSDEIWHFYFGSSLVVHIFNRNDEYKKVILGTDFEKDETPQLVIKKGSIFAAEIKDKNSFSLIGCTVAPGFDFKDFELCQKEKLMENYPDFTELIKRLTK